MERWKNKRKRTKRLVALILFAMSVSMLSVVIVTPKKAAESEAGCLTDFTVSALDNTFMEALGWTADKRENEGIQDIYKMMSAATGVSGTDQIIQYCEDIINTLGVIRQDLGQMDQNLTDMIAGFQNRDTNLVINDRYKNMQSASEQCDIIINTNNDYIEVAESYASAQKSGDASLIAQKKQEAENAGETLTHSLIRVNKDITAPDQIGKISTEDYDNMLAKVNENAGTCGISYREGKKGSPLQQRSATFTRLLYESYSLQNNIFDHQNREAIEAGMNASASQFAKMLLAYRIQLDYVSAENDELVEKGEISQEEADSRIRAYEGKYKDYINALANAFNDVGTMYQNELDKMMHLYDRQTAQKILYGEDHASGEKTTTWYYRNNRVDPVRDELVTITEEPGKTRNLSLPADAGGFLRGNVNGVSYLFSKSTAELVPEDFVYTSTGKKDGGDYTYKLRSRYFYNFKTTTDGAYRMIEEPDDLRGLLDGVAAWEKSTGGFMLYLNDNGHLSVPLDQSGKNPFELNARYILLGKEYKKIHQIPDFTYQVDLNSKKEKYDSDYTDTYYRVLMIMKAAEGITPSYNVSVKKTNAADNSTIQTQQVEVQNGGAVPAGDHLKIKVTPDKGWTLDSLKIIDNATGDELDTLSGPQTFDYVKDENGSCTWSYHMPYRNREDGNTRRLQRNLGRRRTCISKPGTIKLLQGQRLDAESRKRGGGKESHL